MQPSPRNTRYCKHTRIQKEECSKTQHPQKERLLHLTRQLMSSLQVTMHSLTRSNTRIVHICGYFTWALTERIERLLSRKRKQLLSVQALNTLTHGRVEPHEADVVAICAATADTAIRQTKISTPAVRTRRRNIAINYEGGRSVGDDYGGFQARGLKRGDS